MNRLPSDPRVRDALLTELDAILGQTPEAGQQRLDVLRATDPGFADTLSALLAADRRFGDFLEEPLGDWAGSLLQGRDAGSSSFEDRTLGVWRLGPLLGAGGMGRVYSAERVTGDFGQSVAIKVLARGDVQGDLALRFARERVILARLTHPGIARLLDGGVSDDGWPWFALELVRGAPLTDYCRAQAADLRTRLRLFREVADAVAHAHRHLVVHRDLKPSNILVGEDGRVKLLDFGIAKLLADEDDPDLTLAGPRPFTPRYAAPEQVTGGAITTATDIYALGAVLYELLCGRSPHGDAGTPEHELLRAAVELEAPPLIRAARAAREAGAEQAAGVALGAPGRDRLLDGDLQNVVARCLAKDPTRRYASVDALLDDLRRAETGEPVLARPPSRRYVAAKFVRRNRAVVTAGALVLAALLTGLGTTTWQARRAAREATRAEQSRAFLMDIFAAADPSAAPGREVTAREILRQGAADLRGKLAEQPVLRAELLVTVGELLRLVGAYADADTVLSEALAQAEAAHGTGTPAVARVADALGGVVYELGQFARAEELHRRALAINEKTYGRRHVATTASLANLAGVLSQSGDPAASEGLYREVLSIELSLLGPDDPAVATDLNNLAVCLYRSGRTDEADSLHLQALTLRRRVLGDGHPDVATSLHNRAAVLEDLGRATEAEDLYRQALAIRRRLYPRGHVDIAGSLTGLGSLLRDEGRLDEARELLVEAAELNARVYAGSHLELGRSYNALGMLAYSRSLYDEAAGWFGQAHAVLAATIGADNSGTLRTLNNLAVVLHRAGRLDESQRLFEQVIATRLAAGGDQTADLALSAKGLGWVLLDRGHLVRADSLLSSALATLEANPALGAAPLAEARLGIGACRLRQGRLAEAGRLVLPATEELATVYEPGHEMVRRGRELLRELARRQGR